jgi:hypothetical protein
MGESLCRSLYDVGGSLSESGLASCSVTSEPRSRSGSVLHLDLRSPPDWEAAQPHARPACLMTLRKRQLPAGRPPRIRRRAARSDLVIRMRDVRGIAAQAVVREDESLQIVPLGVRVDKTSGRLGRTSFLRVFPTMTRSLRDSRAGYARDEIKTGGRQRPVSPWLDSVWLPLFADALTRLRAPGPARPPAPAAAARRPGRR